MSTQLTTWEKSLSQGHQKFLKTMNYDSNNVPQEVKQKAMQEIGFAYQFMVNNTQLQKCDPASIVNAITNIARTSITLNPVMRLAYLVPRGGKCVLDFSYMGMVSMLKNNGNIRTINAYIVFEDEEFEHDIIENVIRHKPVYKQTEKEHNARTIIGAYSVAKLPSGDIDYCFMPMWEIDKIKNISTGSNSPHSAWAKFKDEMIKKTVIKRHFKMLISINDSFNSKISAMLEIENENNPLDSEFNKPTRSNNRLGTAFIKEEESISVEETNNRLSQIIETDAEVIEESTPEPVAKKTVEPKKETKRTKKVSSTKAEEKPEPVEQPEVEFEGNTVEELEIPNEIVNQETGEILSLDSDEDLITDDMVNEIHDRENDLFGDMQ